MSMADRYRLQGTPVTVVKSKVEGSVQYRVAIGPFLTPEAAREARNNMTLPSGAWLLYVR